MKDKSKYYTTHPIKTIKDMIYKSAANFAGNVAFQEKVNGKWVNLTYIDFLKKAEYLACALYDLGIKNGDKLAIISKNRIDWVISYMAGAISGITIVPLDRELKEQEIHHILHLSGSKGIICSEEYLKMIIYLNKNLSKLKRIICMDKNSEHGVLDIQELYKKGKDLKAKNKTNAIDFKVAPETILSMLFTSGTTGTSKIVPLKHKHVVTNIIDTCCYIYFDDRDKWLSVLPVHHVYECTCGFLIPLYKGASIAFTESLYKIADNAKEAKPSVLLGVPALYESILKKIISTIKSKPLGRFKLGLGFFICKIAKSVFGKDVRKKVFSELHEKFGGKFRLFITGGAAANPEVSKKFQKFGFDFIQGAGMTETSPIYALNPDWHSKDEAIGLPLPGIELKILNPDSNGIGEIAIKGGSVFDGYHNAPEINKNSFEGEWFKSGDLGYKDKDGYYYITGRKKNVIVTSGGKNIYPEEIEQWLNKSPFILESLVWSGKINEGDKEEVHAIVVPDFEYFDEHCIENNLDKNGELIRNIIHKEIKHYSSHLAVYKRVKKFNIRNEEFMKTTTKKIKRYLELSQLSGETEIET